MRRLRREDEVARIRERLLRFGFPRLRMLLLVLLTGGSGLLASWLMLRAGVVSMPLRYVVALLVAYGVFLLLLRVFAEHGPAENFDIPGNTSNTNTEGARLDFGSTGSGGSARGGSGSSGSWLDGALADDGVLVLVLLIVVFAVACAAMWVVLSAPTLFAELVVDGALSATLYRRLRGIETRHWLDTAVRHTIVPFAVTAVAVLAFALVAQYLRPQAHSLGEVFKPRTQQAGTR